MGLIIVSLLKTCWRWSQLYLTLLILIVERIVRFFLSTFLGSIPFYCYFGDKLYPSKKYYSDQEKDYERDAIELIRSRGYPHEEHFVTTPDGFILGLHRITGPKSFITPYNSPPDSPNSSNSSVQPTNYFYDRQQQSNHQSSSSSTPLNVNSDDITYIDEASTLHHRGRGLGSSVNGASSSPAVSSTTTNTSLQNAISQKPVVLIMHGFMQTSEAWLCRSKTEDSLPFILAEAGFDVWLGNNRGNKYSFKHTKYTPNQEGFWNWSLDELVRYDLPSIVEFICDRTGASSITYIGFSQGTAQGWASLSTNTNIAKKINLFIALAPVSTVKGFSNPMIDSLARSRPDFIFLLFGKKSMMPSTLFWRNILPKNFFVKVIDASVSFLFGWHTNNISPDEKAMLYSHIFSYTSVKSVVHWFQIIQTNRFQMFDDILLGITPDQNSTKPNRYHGRVIPGYNPSQVLTKCAIFYGGSDNLPNTKALLSLIPREKLVMVHEEEKYEHLDFMWGKDASKKVFSKIVNLINSVYQ